MVYLEQFCSSCDLKMPSLKNCHRKVQKFPVEKSKTALAVLYAVLLLNCLGAKLTYLWRLNLVPLLAEII